MAKGGFEMVRYADDFIVLCSSQEQAQEALERVRRWVEENGLTLHPTKTRLVDASQAGGFDFLGYHFERGMKWPRKKSMDKLKDTIRAKTRRTDGRSLKAICEDGLGTSSTAKRLYSGPSMATRAVDCVAFSESGWPNGGAHAVGTISAGQILTSPQWACSP